MKLNELEAGMTVSIEEIPEGRVIFFLPHARDCLMVRPVQPGLPWGLQTVWGKLRNLPLQTMGVWRNGVNNWQYAENGGVNFITQGTQVVVYHVDYDGTQIQPRHYSTENGWEDLPAQNKSLW